MPSSVTSNHASVNFHDRQHQDTAANQNKPRLSMYGAVMSRWK